MKSVLISIKPKWVEKIVTGEKKIEVRKTIPKIETPFKCYIYMSQGNLKDLGSYSEWIYKNRMKVIGEFFCNKIDEYTFSRYEAEYRITHVEQKLMCLNYPEMIQYGKGETLYGWHISDLKIYDKPKELGEFKISCNRINLCGCDCNRFTGKPWDICNDKITRPPQSYMYVEGLE